MYHQGMTNNWTGGTSRERVICSGTSAFIRDGLPTGSTEIGVVFVVSGLQGKSLRADIDSQNSNKKPFLL